MLTAPNQPYQHSQMPRLGLLEVSEIKTSDVLKVLTPIWREKPETACRVKQRISAIMDW